MNTLPCFAAAGLLALALPALAGTATVAYVAPEKYTDAAYSHAVANERDRAIVQRDLTAHFQRLAESLLPAGESLRIEVLDIDLAGHFDPFRFHGAGVRILTDITPPRIRLHCTLVRGAEVLATGDEHLSDLNYQMWNARYDSADPLRYEKALLDAWFRKRFGPQ